MSRKSRSLGLIDRGNASKKFNTPISDKLWIRTDVAGDRQEKNYIVHR